jgi:hypothetical protein
MAWIGATIGAVVGIGQGILGSSQASAQNDELKRQYEEQKKINQKQADITNAYLKESHAAEKKDYFAAREFQWDVAVENWQYETEIQDFRYLQDVKRYKQSAENYVNQLTFNSIGAQMAYESQQAQFDELLASQAFEGQANLVENLQNQGRVALTQAGASRTKALQTTLAEQGRNAAIMAESLRSGAQESMRNMREIGLQKYGADLQATANLMIRPERLPGIPQPRMGPERTFVEPAEVLPGAVPPPQYANTMMPLVSSISSAATGFVNAWDFKTGKWKTT